jgi:hypothetical protein
MRVAPLSLSASAPRSTRFARGITFLISIAFAATFVAAYRPPRSFDRAPFVADSAFGDVMPAAELSANAAGYSGAVEMHFALPGERIGSPLEVLDDTASLDYVWEDITGSLPSDSVRVLSGDSLVAPSNPGFYRLAVVRDGLRRPVDGITLAVLVPFADKKGPVLDGYRIGTYSSERRGHAVHDEEERPEGFVRVMPSEVELPITRHLRLGDLITRDGQETWPRFVAVSPRMVDKLELVVARVAHSLEARPGWDRGHVEVLLNVHSGFRTPWYNRRVPRAARDSRHQYGDAVDVAIDANGDGRLDARDARLVAAAVDSVEAEYPDLTGGVGLYTSRRYSHPYVHIDTRGTRVRWRG